MHASSPAGAGTQLLASELRTEYLVEPLGLDRPQPRLGWTLVASQPARGLRQTAYQVRVAQDPDELPGQASLWDSGIVESDTTSHVAYAGLPLISRARCHWSVRVRDQQ